MNQKLPRLFVCYSRKDEEFAERLVNDLLAKDFEVWLDKRNILPGANWGDSIQEGLDSAETMLLIVTPDSMASKNVASEWQYYFDNDKDIIPLLLSITKMPFQLNRLQHIDFMNLSYEVAFQSLLERLTLDESTPDSTLMVEVLSSPAKQFTSLLLKLKQAEIAQKWVEVIQLGELILASDKNHKLVREKVARAYRHTGLLIANNEKNHDMAIAYFNRAIDLDPCADYYYCRAASYQWKADYLNAIADYNQAIKSDPTEPVYFYGRGNCYQNLKEYDKAIGDYRSAIVLDPTNPIYFYRRGLSYDHQGFYEEAVGDYTTAIDLDSTNADYYHKRGAAHHWLKNYLQAIDDFSRAITLDPNNGDHFQQRSVNFRELGDFDRAFSDIDHAIDLKPNEGFFYYSRSVTYGLLINRQIESRIDLKHAAELGCKSAIDKLAELK